ncbi:MULTISPECIES: DUF1707 domain-containing protein [unclassified Streptomyces]|uniref:DUF1707 SHOCT-like domain-containing protein n=1 Tax=unclassified Streptomyces TaxID=2593676 RepID=UPI00081E2F85|nr:MULTISPECIES: DUF1707 domain-containing protein [unclassified Streptomyces]MYZ37821.1 DUF1707 domain-containing protein [Streptomyces sp. SID4917]SCF94409.1 protein of unknown function [Streptomyces sp. MnatMP-M17]
MTSERPDPGPGPGPSPSSSPGPDPDTRASDAEREQVAERLREAVAEGRLDMEEFDERLDATYKARTHGELVPLVRDLPAPGTATDVALAPSSGGGVSTWSDRIGKERATSKGAFAFWGGFGRKGTWTVGRKFTAVVLQAGGEIDLREARFEDRDVVIRCFTVMGGVHVTVPPDMDVEVRGFGFMGGFGEVGDAEVSPGSPRVIITGFALMGGVGVERKIRESEKRRLKEERKRQRLEKKDRKQLD